MLNDCLYHIDGTDVLGEEVESIAKDVLKTIVSKLPKEVRTYETVEWVLEEGEKRLRNTPIRL